jgi:hypothetical protein
VSVLVATATVMPRHRPHHRLNVRKGAAKKPQRAAGHNRDNQGGSRNISDERGECFAGRLRLDRNDDRVGLLQRCQFGIEP